MADTAYPQPVPEHPDDGHTHADADGDVRRWNAGLGAWEDYKISGISTSDPAGSGITIDGGKITIDFNNLPQA